MKTILITGGAGFIGSTLVRQLLAETDVRVINVDKLTYAGNLESLAAVRGDPRHVFACVDICDAPAVRTIIDQHRPDTIVHLAAESHVDRSIDGPADFIRTNLVGTCTILDEALRYWSQLPTDSAAAFRLLHVSTDEVFGSLGAQGRFTEASRYDPSSPYSASKAGADHLARAWHRTWGLPVLVTVSSNNFGPHQFPEKLIPLTIHKALSNESIPVYGFGENVRDWLYVDDHVRALRVVLARGIPGRTYAVGAASEYPNLDVVRSTCALLDELHPDPAGPYHRFITFVADRPGHDLRYAIDATRLCNELGWTPRESFESGLRRTVQWYLDNQEWTARVMSGAYRGERLGLTPR